MRNLGVAAHFPLQRKFCYGALPVGRELTR
jgi:hypothetical protein